MAASWYPIIDRDACQACGTCYNFCPHEVFEQDGDGYPVVERPENCVEFCRGCAKICPADAITYYGDE